MDLYIGLGFNGTYPCRGAIAGPGRVCEGYAVCKVVQGSGLTQAERNNHSKPRYWTCILDSGSTELTLAGGASGPGRVCEGRAVCKVVQGSGFRLNETTMQALILDLYIGLGLNETYPCRGGRFPLQGPASDPGILGRSGAVALLIDHRKRVRITRVEAAARLIATTSSQAGPG